MGVVYSKLEKYNEAKEYHEKALIIRKKIYDEEHADVVRSYNNLEIVYGKLGEHSEAKEYREKAEIIRRKIKDGERVDQPRSNSCVLL